MADAADQDRISNNGNNPQNTSAPAVPPIEAQIAGATIVDEQIVQMPHRDPVPAQEPRVPTPVAPIPTPPAQSAPSGTPVPEVKAAPIPSAPIPVFVPPHPLPIPPPPIQVASVPIPIAPPTPIPPTLPLEAPPAPRVPPQVKAPQNLSDGIAEILKSVKLPERREEKGMADTHRTAPIVASPTPKAPAVAPQPIAPVMTPRAEEKERKMVSPVHTLKDDLQGVVRDKKISVVRAVSLEEDRRARGKKLGEVTPATEQRSKRTFAIIFSVFLLVVIGGAALLGVFVVMQERTGAPPPIPASSILFSEQSVLFSLSNHSPNDLKRTLASARTSSGTLGSITRIIPIITAADSEGAPQERPATFTEFMRALGTQAPDDLLRALGSEFFFGIHTVDENAPLLIVPINSYDHAFAGMLAWEASLNGDLAPAFTTLPALKTGQNGIPSRRTFQDLVMRNYDVRALKDDGGEIQLYYSFPSQHILVIAESPYSFTEVLSRLQAGRQL